MTTRITDFEAQLLSSAVERDGAGLAARRTTRRAHTACLNRIIGKRLVYSNWPHEVTDAGLEALAAHREAAS